MKKNLGIICAALVAWTCLGQGNYNPKYSLERNEAEMAEAKRKGDLYFLSASESIEAAGLIVLEAWELRNNANTRADSLNMLGITTNLVEYNEIAQQRYNAALHERKAKTTILDAESTLLEGEKIYDSFEVSERQEKPTIMTYLTATNCHQRAKDDMRVALEFYLRANNRVGAATIHQIQAADAKRAAQAK